MTTNDATNTPTAAPSDENTTSFRGVVTSGAKEVWFGSPKPGCYQDVKNNSRVVLHSIQELHVRDSVRLECFLADWMARSSHHRGHFVGATITKIVGYDAAGNLVPNVRGRPASEATSAAVTLITLMSKRVVVRVDLPRK
jgi:hypothetical protein